MSREKQIEEMSGFVGQAIDHNSFLGDDRMEGINMKGVAEELYNRTKGEVLALCKIQDFIAELKKKYTEGNK